jgi:hypothetical protein
LSVTRIGDRTGQSKSKAVPTDVIEESYRQMTGQEKVEFTLLVRKELSDAVPGAIRTLAKVAIDGKPAQAAVAAARQIVLLAEKHGILRSSIDPLQSFTDEFMAELEDRRED